LRIYLLVERKWKNQKPSFHRKLRVPTSYILPCPEVQYASPATVIRESGRIERTSFENSGRACPGLRSSSSFVRACWSLRRRCRCLFFKKPQSAVPRSRCLGRYVRAARAPTLRAALYLTASGLLSQQVRRARIVRRMRRRAATSEK
jgi:hypothetical protein